MKRLLALFLCIALLASIAGCGKTPVTTDPVETTTVPATTEYVPSAAEVYADAAAAVQAMTDLKLEITLVQQTVLGADTFKETTKETVQLQGIGTDALAASAEGSFQSGSNYFVETSEVFAGGVVYGTVKNDSYRAEITAEDYLEGLVPAVLLDETLYGSVEQADDGTITFTGATAPESWVDNPYMIFDFAEGTAQVDKNGNLTASTYHAEYLQGAADITLDVTVKISAGSGETITAPENPDDYPLMEESYIVDLFHTVHGYILQAQSVTSSYTETVSLGAALYTTVIQNTMDAWGNDDNQSMAFEYDFMGIDGSTGENYTYSEEGTYHDGKSTLIIDGGEPETGGYSNSSIHSYVEQDLLSCIPDLDDMETITSTVLGGVVILEYTLKDSYGEDIINAILNDNLVDPDGYRAEASKVTLDKAEGTITVDTSTMMPISVNMSVAMSHYIGGSAYVTSMDYQQSMLLGSPTSYETITGEPLAEEEPEDKAQPLCYHVTGPDGQEMWLLGTIHVGDVRTKYLPQAIYDAFDAADALALEFESEAFLEQSEEDPETMAAIIKSFLYTDGSTLKDHVQDQELYDNTIKMLKATGTYNASMLVYKPYFLSQLLDQYFMGHSYALSSDYGVDFLLEDLANEQGKQILSVESGLSQMQMLSNFSDELQEKLLEETVVYGHVFSNMGSRELYELWCDGDEAALIEVIAGDDSDLSEEEKALMDEYNQAVSVDRDAQMLEVAKGYLESGDVVFYAVGLAHLLAESGLVQALRDAGYTVELVTYS